MANKLVSFDLRMLVATLPENCLETLSIHKATTYFCPANIHTAVTGGHTVE